MPYTITVSFSYIDSRMISRIDIEVRLLALIYKRNVSRETRETLRISAYSSVILSIITYSLGIAYTLALICDLFWSAIVVLLISYYRQL